MLQEKLNSVTEYACRSCGRTRLETFLDLGATPLADRLLAEGDIDKPELIFPLRVAFCRDCSLAQITETVSPKSSLRTITPTIPHSRPRC